MLKCDFHIHTSDDKKDSHIKYNTYELIDEMAKRNYDAIALTFHDQDFYPKKIVEYAKKKDIILIRGSEKLVEGKEVLIYNTDATGIDTFEDLKKLPKEALVVAPHPFFLESSCLGNKLIEHIDLFDGIEHSFFYTRWLNLNKKAKRTAQKFKKTLIANSDSHILEQLDRNYTLIDSKKDTASIIRAIKKGKVKIVTRPLSTYTFFKMATMIIIGMTKKLYRSFIKKIRSDS